MREWIEYHKLVGVNHFYLYNNFSDDEYEAILKPYLCSGIVTLIEWPVPQGQISAYKNCIENYSTESDWIGFIDIDEFVVPIKEDTVGSFLDKYQKYPTVLLYWRLFGTSGKIERNVDGLVTEDFTVCWPKYCDIGKCFYNTRFKFDVNFNVSKGFCHSLWGKVYFFNVPPVNCFGHFSNRGFNTAQDSSFPIQINHYFTKSYKEYIVKSKHGDAYFQDNPRNMEYFYEHESKCTFYDDSISKYMKDLKNRMKRL